MTFSSLARYPLETMIAKNQGIPAPGAPENEHSIARPTRPPRAAFRGRIDSFVREYLVDFNGTQAAIRAGYSKKTATMIASELLRKPYVVEKLQAAATKRLEKVDLTAETLLREALLIARSDLGEIIDFSGITPKLRPANEIPEHARRAISSFKVKRIIVGTGEEAREVEVTEFKLWDKLSALDKLGKYLGIFTDELRIKGDPAAPLAFALVGYDRWSIGDGDSIPSSEFVAPKLLEAEVAAGGNGNGHANGNGKKTLPPPAKTG